MGDGFFLSNKRPASFTGPDINVSYPKNQSVYVGFGTVTLAVVFNDASGATGCTYQWYNNSGAISGATSQSYTYAEEPITGTSASYSFYCIVSKNGGTATTNTAVITVKTRYPVLDSSYTSGKKLVTTGNNWYVICAASGTLKFSYLPENKVQICLVGGGGGAGKGWRYVGGGGGGGGSMKTITKSLSANTPYAITIGAGGAASTQNYTGYAADDPKYRGSSGGNTSITIDSTKYSAAGGKGGYSGKLYTDGGVNDYHGGKGTSKDQTVGYGGDAGSDKEAGSNGANGSYPFGESSFELSRQYGAGGPGGSGSDASGTDYPRADGGDYSGGSKGANFSNNAKAPKAHNSSFEGAYGAGGAGGCDRGNQTAGTDGMSGCIIIRNIRS